MAKDEPKKYSTDNQRAKTLKAETGKSSAVGALNTKNRMSSAQGPYQILNSTWKELEKTAGRPLNRKSVEDNDLAFELYTKKSEKALAQNGIEINPGNTYALHVFGQTGGVEYLKRMKSNPDGLSTDGMSKEVINGNKPFFYDESGKPRTNSDSYKKVSSRVGGPDDPGTISIVKNQQKAIAQAQQLNANRQYQQQFQQTQEQPQEIALEEQMTQEDAQQDPQSQETPALQSELSIASNSAGLMYSGNPGGNFILPKQEVVDGVKTSGEASMKAKTFSYGGDIDEKAKTKDKRNFVPGGISLVVPSMTNTAEVNTVPYVKSIPKTNKNLSSSEKKASDRFSSWYSDPATKAKFNKNTGFDPERTTDLIAKGLNTPIVKYDESVVHSVPMPSGAEAEYRSPKVAYTLGDEKYKNTGFIAYRDQGDSQNSAVINHELVHASGFDTTLAPALYRSMGIKLPEKDHSRLDYMKRPEEVYGNFHELRMQLGLKPGQKVDASFLQKTIDEKKINNNFWNYYSGSIDKNGNRDPKEVEKIAKAINTVASTSSNEKENNFVRSAKNGGYLGFADGGEINNGLLNDFNVGGTHEENPNGGVAQGFDESGVQNTVEEGETRMGDYIFSDRLTLDKTDVDNLYLPKEVIGMTYADASKFINEFLEENPFDIIIKRTAESQLDSLKIGSDRAKSFKSQEEEIVAESEIPKFQFSGGPNQESQEDPIQEQPEQFLSPEEQAISEQQELNGSQKAYGGMVRKFSGGGNPLFSGENLGSDIGAGLGVATAGLEIGLDAFKKYDTNDLDNVIGRKSVASSAAMGAAKMGAAAAPLGPWAAGGAAVVGGIVGGIGAAKANKAANKQDMGIVARLHNRKYGELAPEVQNSLPMNSNWNAYGGNINRFDGGTKLNKFGYRLDSENEDFLAKNENRFKVPGMNQFTSNSVLSQEYKLPKHEFKLNDYERNKVLQENQKTVNSFNNKVSNQYYAGEADKKAAYDKEHPYKAPFVMKKDSPLKYAGAVGALSNFINSKKEKARVISSEGYTKTTTPNYFDESIIQNQMNQEMNNRSQAILATSGGSAAAARAMQYANSSEINKLKSDSYSKMYEINNSIRDKDQAETQRISEANVGLRNQDYQANLQEQDYVQGRRDKARDNLYSSVEAIGQEQSDKNLLFNLSGGYKGGVYDPEDKLGFQNMVSNWSQGRKRNSSADGGIMSFVDNYESVQDKKRKYINEIKAQYNG